MRIINAETRDRTGDLQIFSLTLSQLSYRGLDIFFRQRIYIINRHVRRRTKIPWPRFQVSNKRKVRLHMDRYC